MTSTYGIDIVFLHDLDVLDHALRRYDVTSVRIHFVPVGSLEQDWLSVYQYLGVFNSILRKPTFTGITSVVLLPFFKVAISV